MKRRLLLPLLLLVSLLNASAQLTETQLASQQPLTLKGDVLLKTNWDQWGIYARYTPENQVLGCWSTALAQILYYYRLKPHGIVTYTCTKGYQIRDTLSGYPTTWKDFRPAINQSSLSKNVLAVSRYSYLTAIAIGKDFGTPKYRALVNPGPAAEVHFDCLTEFYVCFTGVVPFSADQLAEISKKERIKAVVEAEEIKRIIKKEIDQKRPLYFHMSNLGSYGHSTVIDGYQVLEKKFMVHLNYGAGGYRSGWYELFKPIDVADDIRFRAFMVLRAR